MIIEELRLLVNLPGFLLAELLPDSLLALEEHIDLDTTSDILSNVKYVLCLDTLGKDQ